MWHGRGGDALSDRAGRPGRGDRCVVLGRSLLSYGPALRRGRRPEDHMGGPQGRTHSQLLSNGEIARARSAAGLRIHDDLLPCEGGPGIRRMDESCCNAGGGSGRQSVVIWHLAALWEAIADAIPGETALINGPGRKRKRVGAGKRGAEG